MKLRSLEYLIALASCHYIAAVAAAVAAGAAAVAAAVVVSATQTPNC